MAITDYDSLKLEIASHLDRDDLTSNIPTFIQLAEAMHQRDIRIRQMLVREEITVDDRYVDFPDGMLETIYLRLMTSPISKVEYVTPTQITDKYREGSGKPRYFTMHAEMEFDVDPDASYTGQILYYKALTPLSGDDPTNALLTRAPDAYLYGALTATAPFLLNDERIGVWGALYRAVADGLSNARRQEGKVGTLTSRVSGPTP